MTNKFLVASLILSSCVGCSNTLDEQTAKVIRTLTEKVDRLSNEVNIHAELIKVDGASIEDLRYRGYVDPLEAIIDCANHSLGAAHTYGANLVLLVACDDVRSYLTGSKIKLRIGNPYSIAFIGLEYTLAVGKDTGTARKGVTDSRNGADTVEGKITQTIRPAHWTTLEITVPTKKPDAFQYIGIKLSSNVVELPN